MEYLTIAIIVLLFFYSFFILKLGADLYRKGITAGMNLSKGEAPKELTDKKPKRRTKGEAKELKRYNDILANIEAYDGSSNGQKEIK